ncbi:MAG: TRAP transporter small permease [Pseudomonadota bacterium]
MENKDDKGVLWFLTKFADILNTVATVWTFFLMFFMTADVAGRYFFGRPLTGAPEMVKVSLVALLYLYLPHALWSGRMVRSDLLVPRMSPRLQTIMVILTHLLGTILFAGIVISLWHHMADAWMHGEWEGEGALRVPTAPIRTIVILGSALTSFMYLIRTVQHARTLFKKA